MCRKYQSRSWFKYTESVIPVYGGEGGGDGAEGGEDDDLQRGNFCWDPGSEDSNFFHALPHGVLP